MQIRTVALSAAIAIPMAFNAYASDQSSTQSILDHHLAAFGAGDVNAIMMDYGKDSVLILPNAVLRGKKAIRGAFEAFVAEFSKPGTKFKVNGSKVSDPIAYIFWTADTPDNVYRFASDTFVIKDGKIRYQTVALDVAPKKPTK